MSSRYSDAYKRGQWLKALAEKYSITIVLAKSVPATKWDGVGNLVVLPWSRLYSLSEEDLEVEILKVRDARRLNVKETT